MLSRTIKNVKEDYLSNRTILTEIKKGGLFAEVFICAGLEKSPVTAISVTTSEIVFIDFKKIISVCSTPCDFHSKLIENMLKIIAQKNVMQNNKIELLGKRTIRNKLSSYLLEQVERTNKMFFTIPYNRNELADFICVDRSALSRELGKMSAENIITYYKNEFKILDIEKLGY